MTTKTDTTTSIRIPIRLKKSIQSLAYLNSTSQTNIITSALESYILDNQKKTNKLKIIKIQKSTVETEFWTAKNEINDLKSIRKNKK